MEAVSGSEGGSTYRAVVQFTAANDREILFRDKISTSPALYHAGEPVMVLYLADDPLGSARIDRGIWKWLLPALLLTAGAGLLLCGKSISEIKENPETAQPTQS